MDTSTSVSRKRALRNIAAISILIGLALFVEGCGSGYEVNESDGRVYIQRKSWWQRLFFGQF